MRITGDDVTIFVKYLEKINKIFKGIYVGREKHQNVFIIDNGKIFIRDKKQIPSYAEINLDETLLYNKKNQPTKASGELKRFIELISDVQIKINAIKLFEYIRDYKKTSINEIYITDNDVLINNSTSISGNNDYNHICLGEELLSCDIEDEEFFDYLNEHKKIPSKIYLGDDGKILINEKPDCESYTVFKYNIKFIVFPSVKKDFIESKITVHETDQEGVYDISFYLKDKKGFSTKTITRIIDVDL